MGLLSDFAGPKNHADKSCFAFLLVDCLLPKETVFIHLAESDKSPNLCQKQGLRLRNRTKVPICATVNRWDITDCQLS